MVFLKKNFSYVILLLILFYGIFKIKVLKVLAPVAEFKFKLFVVDTTKFELSLNSATKQTEMIDHTLGWFLYYPSYFLLHVVFIMLLYKRNLKVRNFLILVLSVLIGSLIGGIFFFRLVGLNEVAGIFLGLFRRLFGLPFILLAIEGGRVLYNDVVKLSEEKSEIP